MHVKHGVVIQIKKIVKAVLKQTQINNVAVSIKYTISDTVTMSSARNKIGPRAAACTLFHISFAPLQLLMGDAKQQKNLCLLWQNLAPQLPSRLSQQGP